jgi:type IX secretion system PorP/SprF family membrane protein
MKIKLIIIHFIFVVGIHAQDRSLVLTNTLSDYGANPAFLSSNVNKINLNCRVLSASLKGKYQSLSASYGVEFAKTNYVGFKLLVDERNAYSLFNAELLYAKSLKFNKNHSITLAVNSGIMQGSLSRNFLNEYVNLGDVAVNNNYNKVQFTAGSGMSYQGFEKLKIAFALPMLITGDQKINSAFVSNLSYLFSLDKKWNLSPKLNLYRLTNRSLVDVGFGISWTKLIDLTTYYRTNSSILHAIKYSGKNFSIGYAINYSIGRLKSLYQGTHEFSIGINIGKGKQNSTIKLDDDERAKQDLIHVKTKLLYLKENNVSKEEATKSIIEANKELKKIIGSYKIENSQELAKEVEEIQILMGEIIIKFK